MEVKQIYLTKIEGEYIGYKIGDGKERLLARTPEEASINLMNEISRLLEMRRKIEPIELIKININTTESGLDKEVLSDILGPIEYAIKKVFTQ